MLVEFLRGDTVAAKPLFIETKRVVGLSWGDFYNGRPATWVELDNGDRIKVRGDMQDTVARINYATQHQPKEASMDSIERQYRMSDAPDNIACLKCKALQQLQRHLHEFLARCRVVSGRVFRISALQLGSIYNLSK